MLRSVKIPGIRPDSCNDGVSRSHATPCPLKTRTMTRISDRLRAELEALKAAHERSDARLQRLLIDTRELIARTQLEIDAAEHWEH